MSTVELFQSGRSSVEDTTYLGIAVQPVRERAGPGRPSAREPLVGPPAHEHRLGRQGLIERELAELGAVLDRADPAAALEALVARRVLHDAVERDVVADDDPAHRGVTHPFPASVSVVEHSVR